MKEAPWWFVPAVTLAGVLIAQLVVLWVARTKIREDDRRRWHDKRLSVYSDFTLQLFATRRLLPLSPLQSEEFRPTVIPNRSAEYDAQLNKVYEHVFTIQLVASNEVRQATTHVTEALYETSKNSDNPQEWLARILALDEAKKSFDDAVRLELGITPAQKRVSISADSVWDAIRQVAKVAVFAAVR